MLIELALVYAYKSLSKIEQAQAHWGMARSLLQESILTDAEKPDQEIRPGLSQAQLDSSMPSEYWNDPFTRSIT